MIRPGNRNRPPGRAKDREKGIDMANLFLTLAVVIMAALAGIRIF